MSRFIIFMCLLAVQFNHGLSGKSSDLLSHQRVPPFLCTYVAYPPFSYFKTCGLSRASESRIYLSFTFNVPCMKFIIRYSSFRPVTTKTREEKEIYLHMDIYIHIYMWKNGKIKNHFFTEYKRHYRSFILLYLAINSIVVHLSRRSFSVKCSKENGMKYIAS